MDHSNSADPATKIDFLKNAHEGEYDLWRDYTTPMHETTPLEAEFKTGRFEACGYLSPNGIVGYSIYDAQSLRLTKRNVGVAGDLIFVQRFVYGGSMGLSGDTPMVHRPGDVSIFDWGRPYQGLHQTSYLQGVFLKKESLGIDPGSLVAQPTFPAGSPVATLLSAEMDRLYTPLLGGATQLDASTFERFTACVKLVLKGAFVSRDVRAKARDALRDLICAHIESNLANPDLSTSSILRTFGVSRATLYRMFDNENGVRNYISTRRLFRAVYEITSEPRRRGLIHETAEKWGFSSDANFSRAARNAYGTSPGRLCPTTHADLQPTILTTRPSHLVQLLNRFDAYQSLAA